MGNSQNEFELNSQGYFSRQQIGRLLYWFLMYPLSIAFCGLWLAWGIKGIWGAIIGLITVIVVSHLGWNYVMDLLQKRPILKTDVITKERIAVRGPTHYDIVFSDGERLRALNRRQWEALQEGKTYKIFFTKHTRWLLSYKVIDS